MLIRGYNLLEAKSAGTQCDHAQTPTPSCEEKGSGKSNFAGVLF